MHIPVEVVHRCRISLEHCCRISLVHLRPTIDINAERLKLEGELNRLTFEQAIAAEGDGPAAEALAEVKARLELLHGQLSPLRAEYNQLARQFWVTKEQVKTNKYDLSASRYRSVANEEVYYEKPQVTLARLKTIEKVMMDELEFLEDLL